MMGSHIEANGEVSSRSQNNNNNNNKATFSGTTALIGVLSLILAVISVAVPHWGYYYFGLRQSSWSSISRTFSGDNQGHFGPFQTCRYHLGWYSTCYGQTVFKPTTWLTVAGVMAILTVVFTVIFVVFAVLHVAMQLQRRVIWVEFKTALLIKLITSSLAVICCVVSVAMGALEFELGKRNTGVSYSIGICYYFQDLTLFKVIVVTSLHSFIVLIFVNILLVSLSCLSYRNGEKTQLIMAPRQSHNNAGGGGPTSYEGNGNNSGISVTGSSGVPYLEDQTRPPYYYPNTSTNGSYTNQGFTSATLKVPSSPQPQYDLRPLRTIQPHIHHQRPSSALNPASHSHNQPPPVAAVAPVPTSGVSFTPAGSTRGYHKMNAGGGSMESLDSTQSLALSVGSFGSTTSTGSGPGHLRPSLKKPKNKEMTSISSESSSKRVRLSLGGEQTTV